MAPWAQQVNGLRMSGQKKGFDPLSRLFDSPPPEDRVPLPPISNDPGVDPTDLDAPSGRAPSYTVSNTLSPDDELPLSDGESLERPIAAPLPPPEPPRPAAPAAPAVDPVELAKMLAKAAAARSAISEARL